MSSGTACRRIKLRTGLLGPSLRLDLGTDAGPWEYSQRGQFQPEAARVRAPEVNFVFTRHLSRKQKTRPIASCCLRKLDLIFCKTLRNDLKRLCLVPHSNAQRLSD